MIQEKYWFRSVTKDGQNIIQRVDAPEHYNDVVEETKWRSIRFSKVKDQRNRILVNQVDSFFDTNFSTKTKDFGKAILKFEGYHYRMKERAGKNYLERCMAPALYYKSSK